MRFWLDTEFNSFQGELISLALVGDDGKEFYKVLHLPANIDPWVKINVIPRLFNTYSNKLMEEYCTLKHVQGALYKFLAPYGSVRIIADYPDDIAYFCKAMIVSPGECIMTPPLTFEIAAHLPSTSEKSLYPHNALEDARALKRMYIQHMYST